MALRTGFPQGMFKTSHPLILHKLVNASLCERALENYLNTRPVWFTITSYELGEQWAVRSISAGKMQGFLRVLALLCMSSVCKVRTCKS